jgi:hypothetical protein
MYRKQVRRPGPTTGYGDGWRNKKGILQVKRNMGNSMFIGNGRAGKKSRHSKVSKAVQALKKASRETSVQQAKAWRPSQFEMYVQGMEYVQFGHRELSSMSFWIVSQSASLKPKQVNGLLGRVFGEALNDYRYSHSTVPWILFTPHAADKSAYSQFKYLLEIRFAAFLLSRNVQAYADITAGDFTDFCREILKDAKKVEANAELLSEALAFDANATVDSVFPVQVCYEDEQDENENLAEITADDVAEELEVEVEDEPASFEPMQAEDEVEDEVEPVQDEPEVEPEPVQVEDEVEVEDEDEPASFEPVQVEPEPVQVEAPRRSSRSQAPETGDRVELRFGTGWHKGTLNRIINAVGQKTSRYWVEYDDDSETTAVTLHGIRTDKDIKLID